MTEDVPVISLGVVAQNSNWLHIYTRKFIKLMEDNETGATQLCILAVKRDNLSS